MNVASLELCKTLHELSGWNACWFGYFSGQVRKATDEYDKRCRDYPAYDLGYLLRKLPEKILNKDHKTYWLFIQKSPDNYHASYSEVQNSLSTLLLRTGISPEDAASKLAIELFKQGILKPANITNKEES